MKLEIMRDSRIGAYGAIALALALILRVGALAAALDGGFWRAALSLISWRRALPRRRADAARASAACARRWGWRSGRAARLGQRSPRPGARPLSLGSRSASSRLAWPTRSSRTLGERRRRFGDGRAGSPRDRRADRRRCRRRATMRRDRRLVRTSHWPCGRLGKKRARADFDSPASTSASSIRCRLCASAAAERRPRSPPG